MFKAGKCTAYIYGADGTRLKKIAANTATSAACQAVTPTTAGATTTLTFGMVEFRNYATPAEDLFTYPLPNLRVHHFVSASVLKHHTEVLHRDHQGSVVAMTGVDGLRDEVSLFKPFGVQTSWTDPAAKPEDRGYIGERFDADAGLQYLNARYYDPKLAMFLQPDWWEVMQPGVGVNRYAYAGNDPVNGMDPGGHTYDNPNWFDKALNAVGNWIDSAICGGSCQRDSITQLGGVVAGIAIPGIHQANQAASAYDKGQYVVAATHEVAGMAEVALAVATFGESQILTATPKLTMVERKLAQVTINRYTHTAAVLARVKQLESQGLTVTTEVTFSVDGQVARIDIVASENSMPLFAEEIKTGNGVLERNQPTVFPKIADGTAVPRGGKAANAGFIVGQPLGSTTGPIPFSIRGK